MSEQPYRPGDPGYLAWQARLRRLVRDPPPLDPEDRTDYEMLILNAEDTSEDTGGY